MTLDTLHVKKFIESVRSKPSLWNQHDPMYRRMDCKNLMWRRVSQEMGGKAKIKELKQRWHNLRDVFRRKLKMVTSNKSERQIKKKWLYYDDMLFLSTTMGYDTMGNTLRHKSEVVHSEPECLKPVILRTETLKENWDPKSGTSGVNEGENVEEPLTHDLKQEDIQENIVDQGNCGTSSENGDYHFAMSIIPHMNQVPMHRKLRMRIKISEIIAEESRHKDFSS